MGLLCNRLCEYRIFCLKIVPDENLLRLSPRHCNSIRVAINKALKQRLTQSSGVSAWVFHNCFLIKCRIVYLQILSGWICNVLFSLQHLKFYNIFSFTWLKEQFLWHFAFSRESFLTFGSFSDICITLRLMF